MSSGIALPFEVVFPLWLLVMGSYLHFRFRVAPLALQEWAHTEGYEIVHRENARRRDRRSFAEGTGHWVYRVIVRDKAGRNRDGLARVGHPGRFCISIKRCPVEIRWIDAQSVSPRIQQPKEDHPLWDEALD